MQPYRSITMSHLPAESNPLPQLQLYDNRGRLARRIRHDKTLQKITLRRSGDSISLIVFIALRFITHILHVLRSFQTTHGQLP